MSPHSNLLADLRAFVFRVFRVMAHPTPLADLYPGSVSTTDALPRYLHAISEAIHQAERRADEAETAPVLPVPPHPLFNLFVTRIKFMKEKTASEHEYLLVYVVDRSNNNAEPEVVKCERDVDTGAGAVTQAASSIGVKSSASGTSSPSSRPLRAVDRFTVRRPSSPDDPPADLIYDYTFPADNQPSFDRLLAALSVISRDSPEYILLTRQCYWFAAMVFRALVGGAVQNIRPIAGDITIQPAAEGGRAATPKFAGTFWGLFQVVTDRQIDSVFATSIQEPFLAEASSLRTVVEGRLEVYNKRASGRTQAAAEAENIELRRTQAAAEAENIELRRTQAAVKAHAEASNAENIELRAEIARLKQQVQARPSGSNA
ncbi:hypothetical protein BD414DRAFT_297503 [Trametes punicea]|nr:hypothetical protein BD414DRAFT_297503 [Trametes punicea]